MFGAFLQFVVVSPKVQVTSQLDVTLHDFCKGLETASNIRDLFLHGIAER